MLMTRRFGRTIGETNSNGGRVNRQTETGMGLAATDGRRSYWKNTPEPRSEKYGRAGRPRRDRAHFARTLLLRRVLETKIKRLGPVEARSHPGRLHGRTILKYYTSCTAYTVLRTVGASAVVTR